MKNCRPEVLKTWIERKTDDFLLRKRALRTCLTESIEGNVAVLEYDQKKLGPARKTERDGSETETEHHSGSEPQMRVRYLIVDSFSGTPQLITASLCIRIRGCRCEYKRCIEVQGTEPNAT